MFPLEESLKKEGETPIYVSPETTKIDYSRYTTEFSTLHDCYKKGLTRHINDKCIGRRRKNPDGTLHSTFAWYSRKYIREKAELIGSGFLALNLSKEHSEWEDKKIHMVAIYSKNSSNYMTIDIGMTLQGITIVPIFESQHVNTVEHILNQVKVISCFISACRIRGILDCRKNQKRFKYLQFLLVMDPENLTPELKKEAKQYFIVYTLDDLLEEGLKNKATSWATVSPESIYCISYTNGTTGLPRGAVITHQNMISVFYGIGNRFKFTSKDVHLSYLPLSLIFERTLFIYFITKGVKIGVSYGSIDEIKEDLAILKPTIFVSIPKYYTELYTFIRSDLKKVTGLKRKLTDKAIVSKCSTLKKSASYKHFFYDNFVFNDIKKLFGGKIRIMFTTSAILNRDIVDFLKICFCCPVIEIYGQTECCGSMLATYAKDPASGHVGGPLKHCEFKLVDVPEMNYTSEDLDEKEQKKPRGEVWLRGPNVVSGYFTNEEETAKSFTVDGWYKSGDIGQLLPDSNRLHILGRKTDVIKLAEGKCIMANKLEDIYLFANPQLNDIFIHGENTSNHLVAIVSIDIETLKELKKSISNDAKEEFNANDPRIHTIVLDILNREAENRKFSKFEYIHDVYIETRSFSELWLLTTAFKKKRNKFRLFYRKEIESMCKK